MDNLSTDKNEHEYNFNVRVCDTQIQFKKYNFTFLNCNTCITKLK